MDPINKQNLLENLHLKYRKMDPTKKQSLLEKYKLEIQRNGSYQQTNHSYI